MEGEGTTRDESSLRYLIFFEGLTLTLPCDTIAEGLRSVKGANLYEFVCATGQPKVTQPRPGVFLTGLLWDDELKIKQSLSSSACWFLDMSLYLHPVSYCLAASFTAWLPSCSHGACLRAHREIMDCSGMRLFCFHQNALRAAGDEVWQSFPSSCSTLLPFHSKLHSSIFRPESSPREIFW